jgi:hypothetical protein
MANQHYGFFTSQKNSMMGSMDGVYLTSSSSSATKKDIKGFGTYMYSDNFRKSVTLFAVRSLVKSTWLNQADVYIGREEE